MADEGEFVQLKLRVRASLRTQLEAAASIGSPQLSVNYEAARRLEHSFEQDAYLDPLVHENAELRNHPAPGQRIRQGARHDPPRPARGVSSRSTCGKPGGRRMTTGHIRARGAGAWELKYDLGRDPGTGRRLTRYATVRGTQEAGRGAPARAHGSARSRRACRPEPTNRRRSCPRPESSNGSDRAGSQPGPASTTTSARMVHPANIGQISCRSSHARPGGMARKPCAPTVADGTATAFPPPPSGTLTGSFPRRSPRPCATAW